MNKRLLLLASLILSNYFLLNAQMPVFIDTNLRPKKHGKEVYDSTYNISSDRLASLIGQSIVFAPDEKSAERGYYLVKMEYLDSLGNFTGKRFYPYRENAIDSNYTDYYTLESTPFLILDCIEPKNSSNEPSLILKHPKSNERISLTPARTLWEYSTFSSLPIIVLGYVEKERKKWNGKKFYIISSFHLRKLGDNSHVTIPDQMILEVVDMGIDKKKQDFLLILQDENGEKYYIPQWMAKEDLMDINHKIDIIDCIEKRGTYTQLNEYLTNRYGQRLARKLLGGKLELGYDELMVKVALGVPTKINRSNIGGLKSEQWIYENKDDYSKTIYLYFDEGILTGIQD